MGEESSGSKEGRLKPSLSEALQLILGPHVYRKLKESLDKDMARIAVVFETPRGKTTVWKGDSNLDNIFIPEKATGVFGIHFLWANGFEYTFKDNGTAFKIIEGEGLTISGPKGSIKLREAKARFTAPVTEKGSVLYIDLSKVILVVDLPYSGNFKLAFDTHVDETGKLVVKPTLKRVLDGKIQDSWNVKSIEYLQTYYTAKGEQLNEVLIIHKENGEKKIICLTRQPPTNIESKS